MRHAERAGDRSLIAELFLRAVAIALLLSGEARPVRRSLDAVGPARRSADPWLALISALTHIDAARSTRCGGGSAAGPAYLAGSAGSRDSTMLRASVELLGPGLGFCSTSTTTYRPIQDQLNAPELEALLSLSRGVAVWDPGGRAHDHDLAHRHLEQAVALARTHDFGYLEVVALSVIATLAGERADHVAWCGRQARRSRQLPGSAAIPRPGHPAPRPCSRTRTCWPATPPLLAHATEQVLDAATSCRRRRRSSCTRCTARPARTRVTGRVGSPRCRCPYRRRRPAPPAGDSWPRWPYSSTASRC